MDERIILRKDLRVIGWGGIDWIYLMDSKWFLTMVYNTQDHWVFGLCPSCGILTTQHSASELDLFPSSGKGWQTPALLGHLERANLNHWT
jgi:hypothetical protein